MGVNDSLLITITNQGADFEVLLINDNDFGTDRYKELDTTLTNLGYAFDIYNTLVTEEFPDAATLSFYDVVIWYTGNDGVGLYLWDVSDTNNYKFNQPLIEYLNTGGAVRLQGLDFFYDIYGLAPDNFTEGQFIYDYMGIASYFAQSYTDDGEMGVPQLDVVPGNPICVFTPVQWTYTTMHLVDALELTPFAQGIYTLGPDGYVFDQYYAGVYNQYGNARVLSFTFETARIDTEENTDELFSEVLEYFRLLTDIPENLKTNKYSIIQVCPNPVSDVVTFSSSLVESSSVKISIIDITGRQVYFNDLGFQQAGNYECEVSVRNLNIPSGIYTYSLDINHQTFAGKLVITK